MDTRDSASPLGPGATRTVRVKGALGVPAGAITALMNITVTEGSAESHLRVFRSEKALPPTSAINFSPGETVAYFGAAGRATNFLNFVNAAGTVHLIIDVVAYSV